MDRARIIAQKASNGDKCLFKSVLGIAYSKRVRNVSAFIIAHPSSHQKRFFAISANFLYTSRNWVLHSSIAQKAAHSEKRRRMGDP
jgi:hypothetical protein